MIAKLIVEGKEFSIEILDPELQKLLAPPKKTGYERVDIDERFYSIRADTSIFSPLEAHSNEHNVYYDMANYYSSEAVAGNNARADNLMRQLRRFAVEHRENELDWSRKLLPKYFIRYDSSDASLFIDSGFATKIFGCIYFDTEGAAKIAIETFRDELIWYFTEYKDSL